MLKLKVIKGYQEKSSIESSTREGSAFFLELHDTVQWLGSCCSISGGKMIRQEEEGEGKECGLARGDVLAKLSEDLRSGPERIKERLASGGSSMEERFGVYSYSQIRQLRVKPTAYPGDPLGLSNFFRSLTPTFLPG